MSGEAVIVTVRLTPRDRALLDRLVQAEAPELEELGVEVTIATVLRKLVRQAAKARGIEIADNEIATRRPKTPTPTNSSQEQVRKLLAKRADKRRGLAAEIARRFDVEPAQVSRFKAGTEDFPATKLDALHAFLKTEARGMAPEASAPLKGVGERRSKTPAPAPTRATTTVDLWLRVENNSKFVRGKSRVRAEIEEMLERDHRMKKGRRGEYEITIEFDPSKPNSLDEAIDDLLREMSSMADLRNCFIETDAVERGTERSW